MLDLVTICAFKSDYNTGQIPSTSLARIRPKQKKTSSTPLYNFLLTLCCTGL